MHKDLILPFLHSLVLVELAIRGHCSFWGSYMLGFDSLKCNKTSNRIEESTVAMWETMDYNGVLNKTLQ